jgi:hypothetical protein
LIFKSALHTQLELLFREYEEVLERHAQQWAHLLTDPSFKASEGFQDLVFDPCSRSAHFSLLMDLALENGCKPGPPPDPLDTLALTRQSKIEDFKRVIESSVMGRIAFESVNIPLKTAFVWTDKLKPRKRGPHARLISKRGHVTSFAREDVLFDFYDAYGESAMPTQGFIFRHYIIF